MVPRLCGAEYLRDYKILATFEDGKTGVIDLQHELWGEVFEPLRDVGLFRRFRFDPEADTIVWPTGADLAPEYLYENAVAVSPRPVAEPEVDQPFFPVSKVRVRTSDTGHTFRRHWAVASCDQQLQPQPCARVHGRRLPADLHQRHDLRRAVVQAEGRAREG